MQDEFTSYQNPLTGRYASREMSYNWSPQRKHSTWRRLWLALAESEKELGLPITDQQLEQMRAHLDDIDFEAAAKKEAELRHDVMSHIQVFGALCPDARPIIHLGATSCFVTDNTELIQMRDGLRSLPMSRKNTRTCRLSASPITSRRSLRLSANVFRFIFRTL